MIKEPPRSHNHNNINEGEIYMARSILPLALREELRQYKWIEFSKTSGVEAYKRGGASIYIQPSKVDRDLFTWVVDYDDKSPSKYGSGVIESLSKTLKNS